MVDFQPKKSIPQRQKDFKWGKEREKIKEKAEKPRNPSKRLTSWSKYNSFRYINEIWKKRTTKAIILAGKSNMGSKWYNESNTLFGFSFIETNLFVLN